MAVGFCRPHSGPWTHLFQLQARTRVCLDERVVQFLPPPLETTKNVTSAPEDKRKTTQQTFERTSQGQTTGWFSGALGDGHSHHLSGKITDRRVSGRPTGVPQRRGERPGAVMSAPLLEAFKTKLYICPRRPVAESHTCAFGAGDLIWDSAGFSFLLQSRSKESPGPHYR